MPISRSAALAAWLLAFTTAASAEPKQLWELSGLKAPESVVVDVDAGIAYVSNIDGEINTKDATGSISLVSLDGKIVEADWLSGLDAPKGLALHNGKLYAADVDRLVEIDIKAAKVVSRYPAEGAKLLNDVAASPEGHIYVTDTVTNTIWRLADGKFESWLTDEKLLNPNGVTVQDGRLVVGAWGRIDGEGFATSVPGHLLEVSLADKSVRSLGSGAAVGNLDGVEPLDASSYLVTDFMAGRLLKIDTEGKATTLATLPSGSADIAFVPARRLVLVPLLKDNKLLAFELD
jgi:DNA-binding beta-propeller fold protein YncE